MNELDVHNGECAAVLRTVTLWGLGRRFVVPLGGIHSIDGIDGIDGIDTLVTTQPARSFPPRRQAAHIRAGRALSAPDLGAAR